MRRRDNRTECANSVWPVALGAACALPYRRFVCLLLCVSIAVNGLFFLCYGADGHMSVETAMTHCCGGSEGPDAQPESPVSRPLLTVAAAGGPPCVDLALALTAKHSSHDSKAGKPHARPAASLVANWPSASAPNALPMRSPARQGPMLALLGSVVLRT